MKIVDIRTPPLFYRCEPPYGSAGGMQARRGSLLVEIETDERTVGIGEAGVGGGVTASVIEKVLRPMLIGEDPPASSSVKSSCISRSRSDCDPFLACVRHRRLRCLRGRRKHEAQ
jgi:L-alanine-DL-glutamate epimerase-like enolase superfamily enzyme